MHALVLCLLLSQSPPEELKPLGGEVAAGLGAQMFLAPPNGLQVSFDVHGALTWRLGPGFHLLWGAVIGGHSWPGYDSGPLIFIVDVAGLVGFRIGDRYHLDLAMGVEYPVGSRFWGLTWLARGVFPVAGPFAVHVQLRPELVFVGPQTAWFGFHLTSGAGLSF
jgi:hypothetical protein